MTYIINDGFTGRQLTTTHKPLFVDSMVVNGHEVGFYEHPILGDEAPLLCTVGSDLEFNTTQWWEVPDSDDVHDMLDVYA